MNGYPYCPKCGKNETTFIGCDCEECFEDTTYQCLGCGEVFVAKEENWEIQK